MWKIYAAIGAAAANHIGTTMSARNQKAPGYAGDVNMSSALRGGMQGNLDNSPFIEANTRAINYSSQADNLAMLESAVPGYSAWSNMQSQQAQDYANGVLSPEQADSIQRSAAESSFSTGIRGQAAGYGYAKNIGLAQISNSNRSSQIMQMLEGLSKVNLSGVGQFYSTAQDAINTALTNRSAQQAWMNADQASQNVRKNAFWGALSTSATTWSKMMGGSGEGADMNAYQSYNDMGYTNQNS